MKNSPQALIDVATYHAKTENGVDVYTEASCAAKELYIPDGSTLLSHMIEK
jgi:hypothetical protein